MHCGDVTSLGKTADQLISFLSWFSKLKFTYKIFVAGNHDFYIEKEHESALEIISRYPSVIYLQDQSLILPFKNHNVAFYGSPHQPIYHMGAFKLH